MSMYQCPLVSCKSLDCLIPGQPIRLPYPNPPGISEGRPAWPKADWKRFVVCRDCGQGHEYRAQDVYWALFQSPDLPALTRFCCFEFRCGNEDCALPITTYTHVDPSMTTEDVLVKIFSSQNKPKCARGHELLVLSKPISSKAVDWI